MEKVLIADDDNVSRLAAGAMVRTLGHMPLFADDGLKALGMLQMDDAPRVALLDWKMPGMTGLDVVKAVRARPPAASAATPYLVLVTALREKKSVIEGLTAGADDYITKPFFGEEFRLRISNGVRLVGLQDALAARVRELEEANSKVKTLQGFLVVCSACKKARVAHDYWQALDGYMASHTDVEISHGYCPECFDQEMTKIKKAGIYRKGGGGDP